MGLHQLRGRVPFGKSSDCWGSVCTSRGPECSGFSRFSTWSHYQGLKRGPATGTQEELARMKSREGERRGEREGDVKTEKDGG